MAIPGVAVVVTNLDTGSTRQAASGSQGAYIIPSVAPGRYSLKATLSGHKTYLLPEVRIEVKQLATFDIAMQLGEITETVQVTGEAPLLNSTDATIGTVIQRVELTEMPINGRHFSQLLLLAPGASPDQTGQQESFTVALGEGGVSPAVNGQRSQMNNFRLDGIDNNMRFTNSFGTSPPPDALQEVKSSSHDSDAQISLAAGANINVTTRAGTNNLHGSIWEFVRNDKFSANNYIDNSLGSRKLPYKQNQYGFFIGGPILLPKIIDGRQTKTYFAAYWEGFKSRRTSNTTANVPTQAMRDGDFSSLLGARVGADGLGRDVFANQLYDPMTTRACTTCPQGFIRDPFPNNRIPTSRIHPVARAYMDFLYPLPNRPGSPNLVLEQSRAQDSNNWGIRIDHNFSDYDRVYGRFSQYHIRQRTPGALPAAATDRLNVGLNTVVTYNHVFDPTFLVDVQVGYNRAAIPGRSVPLGEDFHAAVGDNFAEALAFGFLPTSLSLSGGTVGGISFSNSDLANPDYSYQFNFDFKKVKGTQNIGFGFRLLHWRHIIGPAGTSSMTYVPQTTGQPGFNNTGTPLASFFLGLPRDTDKSTVPAGNMWGNVYIAYVQDDWKVTPKLTLNLGLQYAYAMPPLNEADIGIFDYDIALTQPNATNFAYAYLWTGTNPITGQPPNVRRSIMEPDRNNFAPRIGLAYRFMPKMVVRSGFGVFYDFNTNLIQNAGIRVADRSWPYFPSQAISGVNLLQPSSTTLDNPYREATLTSVAPAPATTGTGSFQFDRFARDPYVMQWNLSIERQLPSNILLSVAYLGSGGRKLPAGVQANTALASPDPINPRRPLPNVPRSFTRWTRQVNSSYNALQLKLEKRFSGTLTFRNSYTWSRSFDTTSDSNTGAIEYPADFRLAYGPSDFDRTHTNVFSYVYVLPFGRGKTIFSGASGVVDGILGGWQLSGIVTHRSGRRFSVLTGRDSANIGISFAGSVKADIIGDPTPSGFTPTREKWLNTAAFAMPASGKLGTSARNAFKSDAFGRFDFLLAKDFRLREGLGLQFRTEFFNAFNQTNFGLPVTTITNANFGQILSALSSRDIQFALKLHW
ncbi:MAG: carboxypeptidase regulatory-like domain-containing protein [Acidobacteria bacterium]|nr:carboxypeptidase regulatory-like domain-containing protein [Acidobacteriota bacterium]